MSDDREDCLTRIVSRVDGVSNIALSNDEELQELRAENASLRRELDELRGELQEVKDLAELLAPERDTRKSKEQRAALALSTMHRIASKSNGVHAMDAKGVLEANGGEIGRSFAYEVLETIPDVAGNRDVCWLIRESRNSPDNTRVVLDLNEGHVPASAEGVRIHGGVPADD